MNRAVAKRYIDIYNAQASVGAHEDGHDHDHDHGRDAGVRAIPRSGGCVRGWGIVAGPAGGGGRGVSRACGAR